ncbi:hypothetical protein Tco_0519952 [Tanacetum coccineum]
MEILLVSAPNSTAVDTISDLISNGSWRWPPDWHTRFPNLDLIPIPSLLDDIDDVFVWRDMRATSYYLWFERNSRLSKKKSSTVPQIIEVITSIVRLKLITFKFKKVSTRARLLLDTWKIPSSSMIHDGSFM